MQFEVGRSTKITVTFYKYHLEQFGQIADILYILSTFVHADDILHYFNFEKLIPRKECGLREQDSKHFNLTNISA